MTRALKLTLALSLLFQLVASIRVPRDDSSAVCSEIADTISSIDGVHFAGAIIQFKVNVSLINHAPHQPTGSPAFDNLTHHWVSSSSETPACVVEPENDSDVGRIVRSMAL